MLAAIAASAAEPRFATTLREKPGYPFITSDIELCRITKYDADGKPTWTYDKQVKPIDVWAMPDGTVLIAYLPSPLTKNMGGVRLVDAERKAVFDLPFDDEIMSVQPLENGNFLLAECHYGRITEMDRKGNRIASFNVATPPSGHQTVRQIRLTPKGTVLAAETYSHKLREYARDGKLLKEYDLRFPYYPLPLPDGHTLVGCWNHPEAQVAEVDADGKIIWSIKAVELPKEMGVMHIAAVARLPNGNTLVSTSVKAGKAPNPRAMLFEVTPDKEIVWQMLDPDGSSWLSTVKLLGTEPPKAAAATGHDAASSNTASTNPARVIWPDGASADCPFEKSEQLTGVAFTGRHAEYTEADTWYPSWASDGNLYSPFTDGSVEGVRSSSGPGDWMTGSARIEGDDPLALKVVPLGLHKSGATPYGGRYPCGSLVRDGIWFYGTYCLDHRKFPWDVMGPFVGFRLSRDFGKTWEETPCTPEHPLFGESGKAGAKVKIGSPHFVDFGRNMEHSPDGFAYLLGHGSTRTNATCSWISGDQIFLLRVKPTPEAMNDARAYEFFGGTDGRGEPVWVRALSDMKPLLEWNGHLGCVTATWNPGLKRYLLCTTDGGESGMGAFHTLIMESEKITGPWRRVALMKDFGQQAYFVNFPSKFIGQDGRTLWLCYAANWSAKGLRSDPPGSRYAMCLREIVLMGKGE